MNEYEKEYRILIAIILTLGEDIKVIEDNKIESLSILEYRAAFNSIIEETKQSFARLEKQIEVKTYACDEVKK